MSETVIFWSFGPQIVCFLEPLSNDEIGLKIIKEKSDWSAQEHFEKTLLFCLSNIELKAKWSESCQWKIVDWSAISRSLIT